MSIFSSCIYCGFPLVDHRPKTTAMHPKPLGYLSKVIRHRSAARPKTTKNFLNWLRELNTAHIKVPRHQASSHFGYLHKPSQVCFIGLPNAKFCNKVLVAFFDRFAVPAQGKNTLASRKLFTFLFLALARYEHSKITLEDSYLAIASNKQHKQRTSLHFRL